MIEVDKNPPECWPTLEKVFGVKWEASIVCTCDGKIHSPAGVISPATYVHELVHVEQQRRMTWPLYLKRYLNDESFRKTVETEAYRAEAAFLEATIRDEHELWCVKHRIAKSMEGGYNGLFTYEEASDILNQNT